MVITQKQIAEFNQNLYTFYAQNKRSFAWRENITAYKIVVSEIMLQQTQTSRVVKKFEQWIDRFPTVHDVARAGQADILSYWQGLGYNRRGLALHKICQLITQDFGGHVPQDPKILQTFPHIGPNTAGSICAFAFNMPTVFIETNIRTVFSYHFFKGQLQICDKDILQLVEQTINKQNPRDWYYALMDYGVHLKKQLPNINSASKHYAKQSKFAGSKREVRGTIIKLLTEFTYIKKEELFALTRQALQANLHPLEPIFDQLHQEGFIKIHDQDVLSL
ncbi:A/G-specific adenine glycosylase [bacterium]|nr:A/G-specific adenine glycosylase [bacterium]